MLVRKLKELFAKLKHRTAQPREAGISALLPVIFVGTLALIVVASMASAASMASVVSSEQNKAVTRSTNEQSIFNSFEAQLRSGGAVMPTATVAGVGSYQLYTSSSTTQPTSLTQSGVTKLTTGTIPSTAKWILFSMEPTGESSSLAIYRYYPVGSSVVDNAIEWRGAINFSGGKVQKSAGVAGKNTIISSHTSGTMRLTNQTELQSDVYAVLGSVSSSSFDSTVRGNLYSKGSFTGGNSAIRGDLVSSSTIGGANIEVSGDRKPNDSSWTAPEVSTLGSVTLPAANVTFTSADCASPESIANKINSYTANTRIAMPAGVCTKLSEMQNLVIEPKANIYLDLTGTYNVGNLEVSGAKGGTLSLNTTNSLSPLALTNVSYTNGAHGVILTRGALTLSDTDFTGSIVGLTTARTLTYTNSTLNYIPWQYNSNTATGAANATSSKVAHLVRVS